jgi:hypothetical protein
MPAQTNATSLTSRLRKTRLRKDSAWIQAMTGQLRWPYSKQFKISMVRIPILAWLMFASEFKKPLISNYLIAFSSFNALIDYLNSKNIDVRTCFDPLFLIASDSTPDNAVHFLGVIGYLRYQCGAGFYRESLILI